MKFDRETLVGRIQEEIDRRETEADERNLRAAVEHGHALDAYVLRTSAAWSQLADTIRRKVRTRQPMTNKDFPAELGNDGQWRGGIRVSTWDDKTLSGYVADVTALKTLLDLLASSTSTETSTTELESMGFKMRELFRHR